MARRRRLELPDTAALADLEAGFAARPVPDRMGLAAPIAQVAADAARSALPVDAETRVTLARDSADARNWRDASAAGRVLADLPLDSITADHLVRDRIAVEPEALDELRLSIRGGGMRLPVEVVALGDGRYGLISGWRRLAAVRQLVAEDPTRPATIRAIVRPAAEIGQSYAAMVEENEVRAELSPYERGRIAVVAARQGGFASVEAAVDAIFATASRAKRSKIRGFALIHEHLGDLLAHPTALSERNGLRLAAALRNGAAGALRDALAAGPAVTPAAEWAVMEPAVRMAEAGPTDPSRGGRPKASREVGSGASELQVDRWDDADCVTFRISGADALRHADRIEAALKDLARRL